jgi:hypothetical protein
MSRAGKSALSRRCVDLVDGEPIYRAPMRARDRDLPAGAGAAVGLREGFVGIGDALIEPPDTLAQAIDAASIEHGDKAARMLRGFAHLPAGALVWTQAPDGAFRLGRIRGAWRSAWTGLRWCGVIARV